MAVHPTDRARQVMQQVGDTVAPRPIPNQTGFGRPPDMTDLEWMLACHRAAYAHPNASYPQPSDLDAARRIADMLMKDVE
jgi:hypothetical protein